MQKNVTKFLKFIRLPEFFTAHTLLVWHMYKLDVSLPNANCEKLLKLGKPCISCKNAVCFFSHHFFSFICVANPANSANAHRRKLVVEPAFESRCRRWKWLGILPILWISIKSSFCQNSPEYFPQRNSESYAMINKINIKSEKCVHPLGIGAFVCGLYTSLHLKPWIRKFANEIKVLHQISFNGIWEEVWQRWLQAATHTNIHTHTEYESKKVHIGFMSWIVHNRVASLISSTFTSNEWKSVKGNFTSLCRIQTNAEKAIDTFIHLNRLAESWTITFACC